MLLFFFFRRGDGTGCVRSYHCCLFSVVQLYHTRTETHKNQIEHKTPQSAGVVDVFNDDGGGDDYCSLIFYFILLDTFFLKALSIQNDLRQKAGKTSLHIGTRVRFQNKKSGSHSLFFSQ